MAGCMGRLSQLVNGLACVDESKLTSFLVTEAGGIRELESGICHCFVSVKVTFESGTRQVLLRTPALPASWFELTFTRPSICPAQVGAIDTPPARTETR